MTSKVSEFADALFVAVKGYCAKEFQRLFDPAIAPLKSQISAIPAGRDGKDADPDLVRAAAAEAARQAVAELPPAKDGSDGRDADPAQVAALVEETVAKAVALIPAPKDGRDASPEDIKAAVDGAVAKAVSALPAPKDGRDAEPVDVEVVRTMVAEAVAGLPAPKDGVDGKSVDPVELEAVVRKAVAELPPAKDGRDADADAITKDVLAKITAILDSIPTPVNGKDGRDGTDGASVDPEVVARLVAEQVKEAVAALPAPTNGVDGRDGRDGLDGPNVEEIAGLVRSAVAMIAPPKDGRDGVNGVDGKSVDVEEVRGMVQAAVAEIPAPKNGVDGRDGADAVIDMEAVTGLVDGAVAKAVQALPPAANGRDGIDGRDADPELVRAVVAEVLPAMVDKAQDVLGERLDAAVKALPTPKDGLDGRSVDMAAVEKMVAAMLGDLVAKAVAALPAPKDGANGRDADLELVRAAVEDVVAKIPMPIDGRDGRDGKAGDPGRDALQIEVLPAVDVTRSYPRATYANYRGGVVRSVRTTDPVTDSIEAAGWVVHVDGEAEFEIEQVNERSFAFKRTFTSGRVVEKRVSIPAQIYRGVYDESRVGGYEKGDTATWAGSLWHCNEPTGEKPGIGSKWTLAAKRGRDGADGIAPRTGPAPTVKLPK